MIGMHRVRVVRGYQEASGHSRPDLPVGSAQREPEPCQRVIQESGVCALTAAGSHFFVVEYGADIHRIPGSTPCQCGHAGPCAFQVIDPSAGEIRVACTPDAGVLASVQEQVVTEDPVFLHTGGLRDFPHQPAGALRTAIYREHICLRVKPVSVVDLPVEMDRQAGNQQRVPVQVHQFR